MKKLISIFILSLLFINTKADTHYINSGNFYYSPSSLTVDVNDTVVWLNVQGFHNVNFDISSTTGNSFGNPVSFISSPTGADTMYIHKFTVPGYYEYDCSVGSHAASGMIGNITVNAITDCNGVANGTSLTDTCGVCQQAYIYNFVTHIPTYLNDTFNVVLGPTEILVMPNDPQNPLWNSSCDSSVYDIISNSADHTILEIAIDTCGLASTLDGPGPFTVFAPTDAAFNALPAGTISSLLSNLPALTDILKYHVVGDSVMSSMLSNGQTVTTLEGSDVTVTISGGNVYIENAMVTVADIVGDNGVVHVIDAVLLPPTPSNSVYDIISNSADHTILEIAIDTCGLASTLDGPGPFTVFAPTDAAFNALPAGTISSLLSNLPALTDILKYHVVGDSVMSSMLSNGQTVTTLEGSDVTVTISGGNVYIENAMVTVADIVGDNGVVHVIDAVLLPPSPSNINELKSDDKIIYTVDILGKIVVGQEKKNIILFDIYESGKTIRRLVIN